MLCAFSNFRGWCWRGGAESGGDSPFQHTLARALHCHLVCRYHALCCISCIASRLTSHSTKQVCFLLQKSSAYMFPLTTKRFRHALHLQYPCISIYCFVTSQVNRLLELDVFKLLFCWTSSFPFHKKNMPRKERIIL